MERQIEWILDYFVNGPRGIDIDPCETHLGLPYYGYTRAEDGSLKFAESIAPKQRPVDEMYKRNFHKRQAKLSNSKVDVSNANKRRAVEAVSNVF